MAQKEALNVRTILIAILLILMLATPAAAAGYYHSLTVEVSGEYEMSSNFTAPEVNWTFSAVGIGDLNLDSIVMVEDFKANWWKLF